MIEERDKQFSIYEVPLSLVNHGLDDILVKRLRLKADPLDMSDWRDMVERIKNPKHEVRIAVVGKYMKHRDAYKSVYEALDHAGIANHARVLVVRVEAEEVESRGAEAILGGVDGILVPGGFGMRGIEGKIEAIRYARTHGDPLFRDLPGHAVRRRRVRPRRARARGRQQHRVRPDDRASRSSALMEDQQSVRQRGGTMRLGSWPCALAPDSLARAGLRRRADPRAAPPPLRVQQRLPEGLRGATACRHRHQPRRHASSRSSS